MIHSEIERRFAGDHENQRAIRAYLNAVCEEFVESGLADPKFAYELASGVDQKFWACISEALLARHLQGKTFGMRTSPAGAGPDLLLMNGATKVWVEIICPEPTGIPTDWLNRPPCRGVLVSRPHEAILLRWTSAIKAKSEALVGSEDGKVAGYAKSGLVAPDDAYVIAINGCMLRGSGRRALFGISQFPFAAEAVFPIGPYQVRFDTVTAEPLGQGHQHRLHVLNANGALVPTYAFLDPRYRGISAIWAVDLDGTSCIGSSEPMAVVHNPNAAVPVPIGFLPAHNEYSAIIDGDVVHFSEVEKPDSAPHG